jgi:hypothetical protein
MLDMPDAAEAVDDETLAAPCAPSYSGQSGHRERFAAAEVQGALERGKSASGDDARQNRVIRLVQGVSRE